MVITSSLNGATSSTTIRTNLQGGTTTTTIVIDTGEDEDVNKVRQPRAPIGVRKFSPAPTGIPDGTASQRQRRRLKCKPSLEESTSTSTTAKSKRASSSTTGNKSRNSTNGAGSATTTANYSSIAARTSTHGATNLAPMGIMPPAGKENSASSNTMNNIIGGSNTASNVYSTTVTGSIAGGTNATNANYGNSTSNGTNSSSPSSKHHSNSIATSNANKDKEKPSRSPPKKVYKSAMRGQMVDISDLVSRAANATHTVRISKSREAGDEISIEMQFDQDEI